MSSQPARSLFSFDIGTNSIGWAVLVLNDDGEPTKIVEAGTRIFSDGREPKSGNSLAEGRRLARAMSRRRDRYKRRRKATLRTLVEYGLMPAEAPAQKALLAETSDQADRLTPRSSVVLVQGSSEDGHTEISLEATGPTMPQPASSKEPKFVEILTRRFRGKDLEAHRWRTNSGAPQSTG